VTDDEERAALRDAGMSEVAVEGIIGMAVSQREGLALVVFTPTRAATSTTSAPRRTARTASRRCSTTTIGGWSGI
jgi:hypothetical protein